MEYKTQSICRAFVSVALTGILLWQCFKALDSLWSPTLLNEVKETYEGLMVYPSITVCPLYNDPRLMRPPSNDIAKDYSAMDEEQLIVGVSFLDL